MRFLFAFFLLFSAPAMAKSYVDDYSPTTFENFSNLMWKYDVHENASDDVFNSYFQLTNCDLFKKYYEDDFRWQTIVESFKRDIGYFSKDFPNKFYINASIPIDRYDFGKSAFIIEDEYALDNAGSIRVPFYEPIKTICNKEGINPQYFPRNVKFIADRKFAMNEIPVGMSDANALLERIKAYRYEDAQSDRVVAVRFLITVNSLDNYNGGDRFPQIRYKGSLDEIAFFEDPQMTKLIWKKQFKVFEE